MHLRCRWSRCLYPRCPCSPCARCTLCTLSLHHFPPLHHLPRLLPLQDRLNHLQLAPATLQLAPATVLTRAQLHGAGSQPPLKIAEATPAAEASGVGVQSSFHSLQSDSFDSDETASPQLVRGSFKSMPAVMQLPAGLQSGVLSAGPQNGLQGGMQGGQNPLPGVQGGPQGAGLQGVQGGLEGALHQDGLQDMLQEHGVQDLLQGLNDYKNMLAEYTTQLQTLQNQEMAGRQAAPLQGSS